MRMYKVRQWYPSAQEHRLIWRGPYIKGPADAPPHAGREGVRGRPLTGPSKADELHLSSMVLCGLSGRLTAVRGVVVVAFRGAGGSWAQRGGRLRRGGT